MFLPMEIHRISGRRFLHTVAWAVLASMVIVIIAAALGRATVNLQAAVTDKPDLAVRVLLPEEHIRHLELLRKRTGERHYLAETAKGPKLIILKRGESEWYVSEVEPLRE